MKFLSISEAAGVVQLTPRQIRHLGLGSTRTIHGDARIFDAADLTVLRVFAELVARFKRWDLALWRARAAVLYLEPYIRDAVRGTRRLLIVVDDVRGLCELRQPSAVGPRDTVIRLQAIYAEMTKAVNATRAAEPEIWTGRTFARRPELAMR